MSHKLCVLFVACLMSVLPVVVVGSDTSEAFGDQSGKRTIGVSSTGQTEIIKGTIVRKVVHGSDKPETFSDRSFIAEVGVSAMGDIEIIKGSIVRKIQKTRSGFSEHQEHAQATDDASEKGADEKQHGDRQHRAPHAFDIAPSGSLKAVETLQAQGETCKQMASCISSWSGRLGNNLRQIQSALLVAHEKNYCYVRLPTLPSTLAGLISISPGRLLKASKLAVEQYSIADIPCGDNLTGLGDIKGRVPEIRAALKESIIDPGFLNCNGNYSVDEAVVMHMRSGDISNRAHGFYPQPPCSFYKAVMSKGNHGKPFDKGVIVTEPDLLNPCVHYMHDAFPNQIKISTSVGDEGVHHDACTMATAKHLVVSFGTWGPSLSTLNQNLHNLFIPWVEDAVATDRSYGGQLYGQSDHWYLEAAHEGPLSYNQHLYSFHGFTAADSSFSNGRMVTYGIENIRVRVISRSS